MVDELSLLVAEGNKLAEKRTWLEKGYAELLVSINKALSQIPDMSQNPISFILREYTSGGCCALKRQVVIKLVFDADAYLEMELRKEGEYEWETEPILNPSILTIRTFAAKLEEIFKFFINEVQKINEENNNAIKIISELLEKI